MAARSDYRSGATLVHLVYFCWNPRVIRILCDGDYFGSWFFAPIRSSPSLEILSTPGIGTL